MALNGFKRQPNMNLGISRYIKLLKTHQNQAHFVFVR